MHVKVGWCKNGLTDQILVCWHHSLSQKWITWSEPCLFASLTESKKDYLIRTLSVFITHWVKSMQVRLFSKAARNYLNQKTTCQFRTVAISSSSSTRCLSSGSKLSKDEWREKIKYFKAHVVLSFSSRALFYVLLFLCMLYIFLFSFFYLFSFASGALRIICLWVFFTFFFCIDAWCFSILTR